MFRIVVILGLLTALSPEILLAQQRPFGAGVIIGSPTGLSVKYWQSRRNAVAIGAAWSFEGRDALQLHLDFLRHRYNVFDEPRTPFYYGLGFRVLLQDNDSGLGIRFPLGITHLLDEEPIDFFIELVPVLNLAPNTDFDLQGGIGARFYFRKS